MVTYAREVSKKKKKMAKTFYNDYLCLTDLSVKIVFRIVIADSVKQLSHSLFYTSHIWSRLNI